jgi:hypothetical protein
MQFVFASRYRPKVPAILPTSIGISKKHFLFDFVLADFVVERAKSILRPGNNAPQTRVKGTVEVFQVVSIAW